MQQPQVAYAPGAATVVITQQPSLSPDSIQTFCANCRKTVATKISHENGVLTWLSCLLIFIFGGPFLCCLIPFCCNRCKDVKHRCPQCNNSIGIYRRL